MTAPASLLVLGIGNVLLRDEGVGVVVARRIEAARAAGDPAIPSHTHVIDGGTLGLDLLPMLAEADVLVLIDAVDLGRPPGTTAVLRDDAIEATLSGHVSPHQVGVADLVAAARLLDTMPPRASLVGIQPETIAIGLDLSPAVAAAVEEAVMLVKLELARAATAGAVARADPHAAVGAAVAIGG